MKNSENNEWLDKALSESIGSKKPHTDFELWKQQHPQAVKILKSWANRQAYSQSPLSIRRIIMFNKSKTWKVVAILTVVICVGAIATAVGLKVRKYYFVGRESDGTYVFQTEPETTKTEDGRTVTNMSMVRSKVDPNKKIDMDQKISELEEIDMLRQQNTRELASVIEKEVNGQLWSRTFMFKYVLSDGREVTRGDHDPEFENEFLTEAQEEELVSLLRADKEEDIDFMEKEVRGRIFSFECHRFILNDGTEVIWSRGTPQDD